MQNFVMLGLCLQMERSHTQLQWGEMEHCLIKKLYSLIWASHSSGMTVVICQSFQREDMGPRHSLLWGVICTIFVRKFEGKLYLLVNISSILKSLLEVSYGTAFRVSQRHTSQVGSGFFIIYRILIIMPLTIDNSFYLNCL